MPAPALRRLAWRALSAQHPPCPRSSHQISAHGSRLYLFGGECGPPRSHFGYGLPVGSPAVHCLDLQAPGAWREFPAASGAPPSARLGHGQAIVQEAAGAAYLYVFGGRQPEREGAVYDGSEEVASLNDLHRLNLTSGSWEKLRCTGDVPSPRSYHQMLHLDGSLFVFGGMDEDDRFSDLYTCAIESGSSTHDWRRLPDGPMEGRGGAGVCAVGGRDPRLWVVGGFCGRPVGDVWEFSIAASTWRAREDLALPSPRSIFACGVVGEPDCDSLEIRAFGGELKEAGGNWEAGKYTNETLRIRPAGGGVDVAVVAGEMPAARGWTSGCVTGSSFVVFGGVAEGQQVPGVRLGDLQVLE